MNTGNPSTLCPNNDNEMEGQMPKQPPLPQTCLYEGTMYLSDGLTPIAQTTHKRPYYWNTSTGQSSWNTSFTVQQDRNYVVEIIKCSKPKMALSIRLQLMNPGGHHLSSIFIPIPYIGLGAFGIWLVIGVAWMRNWIKANKVREPN